MIEIDDQCARQFQLRCWYLIGDAFVQYCGSVPNAPLPVSWLKYTNLLFMDVIVNDRGLRGEVADESILV